MITNPTGYKPLKKDVNPYGTKSPTEIFWYLLTNLESMRTGLLKNEDKFVGDWGYYVTHELLPNSAENRRSEISTKPQTALPNKDKDKNKQNRYMRYGQLYKKYQNAFGYLRQKPSKVYAEIIDAVRKARQGIYSQQPRSTLKRPYDPFKKSGLAGKVLQLSKYSRNRNDYPIIKRHDYKTRPKVDYDKNPGGSLEEKLAA